MPDAKRFRRNLRFTILFVGTVVGAIVVQPTNPGIIPFENMVLLLALFVALMFWMASTKSGPRKPGGRFKRMIPAVVGLLMLYAGTHVHLRSTDQTAGRLFVGLVFVLFLLMLVLMFSRELFPRVSWAANPFKLLGGILLVMILIVAISLVAYKFHLDLDRHRYSLPIIVVALIFLSERLIRLLPIWFGRRSRSDQRPTGPV